MTLAPYIHPAILERLKSGTFVADRRSKPGALHLQERRDTLSPLAVTKRCIRYDRHVFDNRKALILRLAESLNDPGKKLAMVSGPQGCGKTSLIRGIVELMGGGREQLLWFDVNIHTDFDEVIGFLIQSITTLCSALSVAPSPTERPSARLRPASPDPTPADPFAHLERLIERVSDVPLLIVIDNIEYLVNADHQLLSQPLKETLNYLLSFSNIKVILCGERLPYADIRARGPAMTHLPLEGLSHSEVQALVAESSFPALSQRNMMALCRKTHGHPWLLKLVFYLQKRLASDPQGHAAFLTELNAFLDDRATAALPLGVDQDALDGLEAASPVEPIIQFVYRRLTPQERALAHALALIRHPVDTITLEAMFPGLLPAAREQAAAMLDHSLLTPLMKRIFSPQAVMAHIRKRHEPPSTFAPSYEFYRQARKLLLPLIPEAEQLQLHRALEAFYLRERDLPQSRRAYPVKSRILADEARRHATMARQRRTGSTRDGGGAIFRTSAPTRGVFSAPVVPLSPVAGPPSLTEATGDSLPLAVASPSASAGQMPASAMAFAPSEAAVGGLGQALPPWLPSPPPDPAPDMPDTFRQALAAAARVSEPTPGLPEAPVPEPPVASPEPLPPSEASAESADFRPDLPADLAAELPADTHARAIQQQLAEAVTRRDTPGITRALLELADCRQNAGRSHDAEACLRAALSHDKALPVLDRALLYRRWGRFCAETFRRREALEALTQVLQLLDPFEPASDDEAATCQALRLEVCDQTGDLLSAQNRPHEALAAYFKAIDLLPAVQSAPERHRSYAERYFKIAQLYDDLGMPDNALTYYEQCLSLDRESGSALACAATLTNIGAVYLEQERPQEALAAFKAALEYDRQAQNPEGAHQTLMLMALAQGRMGETASAEDCYRQALANAIREENALWKANVYLKLGRLYQHEGDAERALIHYQSARASIDPADVSADSLAFLDQQIKETLDAIQHSGHPGPSDPAG